MRRLVGACVLGLALAAAPASAQESAPSVTAIGVAQVTVLKRPTVVMNNASIARAVKAAGIQAIPLAIADARARAGRIAAAAGLVLGPIVSVSEQASPYAPYGPITFSPLVTAAFGPGQYCRTVMRPIVRTDASGRRRVVRRVPQRQCTIPPFASVALAATFSAAPPPPPPPCLAEGTCVHG
jgi:uncharacterized protein DUF541